MEPLDLSLQGACNVVARLPLTGIRPRWHGLRTMTVYEVTPLDPVYPLSRETIHGF